MSEDQVETEAGTTTRRVLLAGAGFAGAGALLAACGTEPTSNGNGNPPPPPPPAAGDTGDTGNEGDTDDEGDDAPPPGALAQASEVEVGGGLILAAEGVVITQPAAGDFRGFSNVCTHEGCPVASVSDGTINCTCHGSRFSIVDGSVQSGPATRELGSVAVTVDGDSIVRA